MDKKALLQLLNKKEVHKYGFTIAFFIIFSFFLVFAIRPNLVTAFTLQKELQDLKIKNKKSEAVILQVVSYQSTLEEYRDKLPLLDQAVPSSPTVAQVVDEVKKSASDSGLLANTISVQQIHLKKGSSTKNQSEQPTPAPEDRSMVKKDVSSFKIDLNATGKITNVNSFLN